MRRSAPILAGLLSLVATPLLAATSGAVAGMDYGHELSKWLWRLAPGMVLVAALVALVALGPLRRATPRGRLGIALVAIVVGLPLSVGIPLLAWNLAKEAPYMEEVHAWNRLQSGVQLTDGSGTTVPIPACGQATARLDIHRMTIDAGSRYLATVGGTAPGPRYLVIGLGPPVGVDDYSRTPPTELPSCVPIPY
jgi:hypothetical protein